MIWYDTSEKYIGQWTDSLQNGLGIQIWYEAKGEQKYLRNRYVGEWRNGFRHGYGVFFYSNGSKYEGTWDQNYKHGYGVFTFYDGSQYTGKFLNDRMVDFNSSGLYAPSSLARINDNRNISTANSQTKGTAGVTRKGNNNNNSTVSVVIKESEMENQVTSSNLNNLNNLNNNKERDNKTVSSSNNTSNVGGVPDRVRNNLKGLEEIPENSESITSGNIINSRNFLLANNNNNNVTTKENNQANNNNNNNNSFINVEAVRKDQVVSSRAANNKEAELNQFKTSLDITDIIECEPDIENSLREVENILLRHLTEMKEWYAKYIYKGKESSKEDLNQTYNASAQNENSRLGINFLRDDKHDDKDKDGRKNSYEKTSIMEGIYNNDLGFCMELKDMWKFLRESNILTSEFSLAQFNRIFFKGPKNYIEMFMCPEDLDQKYMYDYVYLMITKSREEFMSKHKNYFDKLKKGELTGFDNFADTVTSKERESVNGFTQFFTPLANPNTNLNYKTNELEINFDIHNKHQVILLRQFYEAIVRIAYMKYFHVNQPLFVKLKWLIDNCIKLNPNFLKKSNVKKSINNITTETSFNASVLEMKVKSYENTMEIFFSTHENVLRGLFKSLYFKSTSSPKKYDMTITYRFFYENIVLKSSKLREFLEAKYKFIGLINIYHKDKILIAEEIKITKETFAYMENILDCEFIFNEFCEMIFFISRKYFLHFNIKENYIEVIKLFHNLIEKCRHVSEDSEKMKYNFPTLPHHLVYDTILQNKRQKEEEARRKLIETKRMELERKLMTLEDLNVIHDKGIEEEDEEEYEEEDD